jgi:hypothetical protein
MTVTRQIKRNRGRPPVPADYLYTLFQYVEEERHRTGLSVNAVCALIGNLIRKWGPLQFKQKNSKAIVEIKDIGTLRARYYEVRAAATKGHVGTEPHQLREASRTGDSWVMIVPETYISPRTGKTLTAMRVIGTWGATKKTLQTRRHEALQKRRRKLHNK